MRSHDRFRFGVSYDVSDFAFAVKRVDRNDDHPGFDAGQEEVNKFDAVRHKKAQPVASRNASRFDEARDPVAPRVQFAEGQGGDGAAYIIEFERVFHRAPGEREIEEIKQLHGKKGTENVEIIECAERPQKRFYSLLLTSEVVGAKRIT